VLFLWGSDVVKFCCSTFGVRHLVFDIGPCSTFSCSTFERSTFGLFWHSTFGRSTFCRSTKYVPIFEDFGIENVVIYSGHLEYLMTIGYTYFVVILHIFPRFVI
jgi:hypothetical protein